MTDLPDLTLKQEALCHVGCWQGKRTCKGENDEIAGWLYILMAANIYFEILVLLSC